MDDANVTANIIETDLVNAVARGQTSVQSTNSYNEVLSSARDQFCPLITKNIIIKDQAPWYDHRMVSLHRQRRKAKRVWRRLRTDSSQTVYIAAWRAVVKQIFVPTEYLPAESKAYAHLPRWGLVVTDLITSPVVSWRGWETPPPPPQHHGSTVILCSTTAG